MNIGHIAGGTRAGWRTLRMAAKDWKCPGCGKLLKYYWTRCPSCDHPRT